MLKQRVITALVLIAILLPALFAPDAWPFALLSLVAIAAAGWEWGRLNGAGAASALLGGLLAAACAAALWAGWGEVAPRLVWWLAMGGWVLGGAFALRGGPKAWPAIPVALRLAIGLALLWTAWLALATARSIGINFILSAFCLVWAADIAAYFGGRAFGRRKLAPAVSPGKTIEGLIGGLVVAPIAAAALAPWGLPEVPLYLAGVVGLILAAFGVGGDLFESLLKRSAGMKDSSTLIPGHGGVLDRVDAYLFAAPVFYLLLRYWK